MQKPSGIAAVTRLLTLLAVGVLAFVGLRVGRALLTTPESAWESPPPERPSASLVQPASSSQVASSPASASQPPSSQPSSSPVSSSQASSQRPSDTGAPIIALNWPVVGDYVSADLTSYEGHTGIDMPRDYGSAIRAAADGTVVEADEDQTGYGKHILLAHQNDCQTLYAHCSKLLVQEGEKVKVGQIIARVGRTGTATTDHLHFELRCHDQYYDPRDYAIAFSR